MLVDCDNTMGLARHEIDDGLTLLMLLGSDAVDVVGVTTVFGNGPEDSVYSHTRELLIDAGRPDIPVVRGASRAGDYGTAAVSFIARVAREHRGRLAVLAIGPLTNLAGALGIDPDFGKNINRAYIMGGYLRRLRLLRREVAELNLSSDPVSAATVLFSGIAITLMSAQICLQARYGLRHLLSDVIGRRRLGHLILEWFVFFSRHCGTVGFYLWDLVPGWAILDSSRFRHRRVRIVSTADDLARGTLRTQEVSPGLDCEAGVIDLPGRIYRRFGIAGDCARLWRQVPLRGYSRRGYSRYPHRKERPQ
ncbi:MAG: nucleoside hydrolase [Spirochaetia bacterium]